MCVRPLRLPALMGLLALPLVLSALLLFTQTALAAEPPIDWPPESDPLARPASPPSGPTGGAQCFFNWLATTFLSVRDGNWEVYTNELCGGVVTRLTETAADEARPALSPDAEWIAYDSDQDGDGRREIWIMRYDGSESRALMQGGESAWAPSWSPDGAHIVFVRGATSRADLYIAEVATGAMRPLVVGPSAEFDPSWSSDGNILFVRAADDDLGQIIEIDPVTGAETLVAADLLRYVRFPERSPHGLLIAFSYDGDGDGWLDIGRIDAGAGVRLAHRALNSEASGCHYLLDGWGLGYVLHEFAGAPMFTSACAELVENQWTPIHYWTYAGCVSTTCPPPSPEQIDRDASVAVINRDKTPPEIAILPQGRLVLSDYHMVLFQTEDRGPYISNYVSHEPQQQRVGTSEIVEFSSLAPLTRPYFPPCETMSVRGHARDLAGNWSTWTEWITATGYRAQMDGTVVDIRDVPLPGVQVTVTPAVEPFVRTGLLGDYLTHACDYFNLVTEVTAPQGAWQGPGPASSQNVGWNLSRTQVIRSTEGLVFAEGFDGTTPNLPVGWTTPFTQVRTSSEGYAGDALQFMRPRSDNTIEPPLTADTKLWARATRARMPSAYPDHGLTLSFMARWWQVDSYSHVLSVDLQTTLWPTATTVYTLPLVEDYSTVAPFAHLWVPLDLPIGDQITVTVALSVPGGAYIPDVWVDDIVIGSWWTPVITDVQVGAASIAASGPITITGENFVEPVSVELSNGLDRVPLPATVVDEETLTAVIPADLPLGLLSILVTNQTGTPLAIQTALPNALVSGPPVWLPFVSYP